MDTKHVCYSGVQESWVKSHRGSSNGSHTGLLSFPGNRYRDFLTNTEVDILGISFLLVEITLYSVSI